MKILSNQVKCLKCEDEPFSAHRHDYKRCKCGAIAVDGGMDYMRRVGDGSYKDMSITVTDELYESLKQTLEWCQETSRNDLGVICALFRVLRDHGVISNDVT
jgi:hypothetical protein